MRTLLRSRSALAGKVDLRTGESAPVTGLAVDQAGTLLAATTAAGEVLALRPDGTVSVATDLPFPLPPPIVRSDGTWVSLGSRPVVLRKGGALEVPGAAPLSISRVAEAGGTLAVVAGSTSVHVFGADLERRAVVRSPRVAEIHRVAVSPRGDRIAIVGAAKQPGTLVVDVVDTRGRNVANLEKSLGMVEQIVEAAFVSTAGGLGVLVTTSARSVGLHVDRNVEVDLPSPGAASSAWAGADGSAAYGLLDGSVVAFPPDAPPIRVQPRPAWGAREAGAAIHGDPFVAARWDGPRRRIVGLTRTGFLHLVDPAGKTLAIRSAFSAESVGRPPTEGDGRVLSSPFEGRSLATQQLLIRASGARGALDIDASGRIYTGAWDGTARVWEPSAALIETLPSTNRLPVDALLARGDTTWIARSGALSLFVRGRPAAELVVTERDWLLFTPDGYFDGSRGAGELAVAVRGDRAYPLAQLAGRMNRADVVLTRLGRGTDEQRAYYKERHERRARSIGATEEGAASLTDVPSVRVGSVRSEGGRIVLSVEASGSRELERLLVRVTGSQSPVSHSRERARLVS